MHMRFTWSPSRVCVKLRISDAREYYIQGETVCGDVSLDVSLDESRGQCFVRSLRVELVCTDTIDFRVPRQTLQHYRRAETVVQKEHVGKGCHVYGYKIRVPNNRGRDPSSYEVSRNCGIRWYIQAIGEVEMPSGKLRVAEDSVTICVFAAPTSLEKKEVAKRSVTARRWANFKYSIDIPMWTRQAPNVFDAVIAVEFDTPTVVRSVEVYLESCAVVLCGTACKVRLRCTPIDTIRVDERVKSFKLDGASRGWQVKGPLPTSFNSARIHVRHNFSIVLTCGGWKRYTLGRLNIPLAAPGTQCHAALSSTPPAYIESGEHKGKPKSEPKSGPESEPEGCNEKPAAVQSV